MSAVSAETKSSNGATPVGISAFAALGDALNIQSSALGRLALTLRGRCRRRELRRYRHQRLGSGPGPAVGNRRWAKRG